LKDFEGGPVIGVVGLNGSSGYDPDEELVSWLTRNRIYRKIETAEIFLIIIFQSGDDPF
jgi:hypothetical protein